MSEHTTTGEGRAVGDGDGGHAGERVGLFESHRWLIPATVVFSVFAAFAAMILLTWIAGGSTPFD